VTTSRSWSLHTWREVVDLVRGCCIAHFDPWRWVCWYTYTGLFRHILAGLCFKRYIWYISWTSLVTTEPYFVRGSLPKKKPCNFSYARCRGLSNTNFQVSLLYGYIVCTFWPKARLKEVTFSNRDPKKWAVHISCQINESYSCLCCMCIRFFRQKSMF